MPTSYLPRRFFHISCCYLCRMKLSITKFFIRRQCQLKLWRAYTLFWWKFPLLHFVFYTTRKRSYGKVMFSVVSVRVGHCTGPQIQTHCTGVPSPDIFKLVQIGPHCTGILFPGHVKLVQHGTYCTGRPPPLSHRTCSSWRVQLKLWTHHASSVKRQPERQIGSHWNALWRLKIGPRPIPKRHHRLTLAAGAGADADAAARCDYNLRRHCTGTPFWTHSNLLTVKHRLT